MFKWSFYLYIFILLHILTGHLSIYINKFLPLPLPFHFPLIHLPPPLLPVQFSLISSYNVSFSSTTFRYPFPPFALTLFPLLHSLPFPTLILSLSSTLLKFAPIVYVFKFKQQYPNILLIQKCFTLIFWYLKLVFL